MKPVIIYPGSKNDFYTEIRERIPQDIRVFCEPFVGGGSTTLNLLEDLEFSIEKVVIGDVSPRIATFWEVLVADPIGLSKRFDALFKPFEDAINHLGTRREAHLAMDWFCKIKAGDKAKTTVKYEQVAKVRKEIFERHVELLDLSVDDTMTLAAQTAVMHNISYSGVAFVGGVSYQRVVKTQTGGKQEAYIRASRLLNGVNAKVVCGDFTLTCAEILNEPDSFVYLDPPYVLQADKLYENGIFEHERLAHYLEEIAEDVRFLLSYDDSVYIRKLYRERNNISVDTYKLPRGYCAGSGGKETSLDGEELFISNYEL